MSWVDVPVEKVAERLEQAAEWLREHSLAKEVFWSSNGGTAGWPDAACTVGALRIVGNRPLRFAGDVADPVSRAAEAAIANRLPRDFGEESGSRVFRWNDEAGRTREEVVDMLLETAKDLRNGESL